jgi:hypothetical protein
MEIREFFQEALHIDIAFHRKEYDDYGWSMGFANSGNRITAQWKRDNLVFNSDINLVCIPKDKWMRKNAGGYSPEKEKTELIILKDTDNIDWLVFAAIHELCHTLCQMLGLKDITHDVNPEKHQKPEYLNELKDVVKYIQEHLKK